MSDATSVGAHRADPLLARAHARDEHDRLARQARATDAGRQFTRCFPRWLAALDHLRWPALVRLAHGEPGGPKHPHAAGSPPPGEPVDPNDPDAWSSRDEHAHAVLRRHGVSGVAPTRLTLEAIARLIDGQAAADRAAGLDWTPVTVPARDLDRMLARAHERLPIDLDDPGVWCRRADQRAAVGRQLGLPDRQIDELSPW